jgi:hypothetical protein
MDHRRAVARDDHRARGGIQVKAAFVLAALATTAYADPTPEVARLPPQIERVEPPPNARTEAWIATGVSAAIIGMGVFSVVRMKQESDTANSYFGMPEHYAEWHDAVASNDRWFHATLVFGGLSVVSVAVTGILWSRSVPSYRVAVTPQGAVVGYAHNF